MPSTIAAISDIHYAGSCPSPKRRGDFGDVFLRRVVHRLNRFIRPDVVLVLGDCLDNPSAPDAMDRLAQLKEILSLLTCPAIVIPGNHDPESDLFYQAMGRPAEVVDIGNVRFLPFLDSEQPGWNAERSPQDLARLEGARRDHHGPVVALQHVPVLPRSRTACPYTYTNLDAILEGLASQAITLTIGGHYHRGTDLVYHQGCACIAVPALCEEPFAFTVITIEGDSVKATHHALQMPEHLELTDSHVHTQFAYCSSDMEIRKSVELAELFGLGGIVFTEHSGQLYFDSHTYWPGAFCQDGVEYRQGQQLRAGDYWAEVGSIAGANVWAGLEVDCDYRGQPVLRPEDRKQAALLTGALHFLPGLPTQQPSTEQLAGDFLRMLQSFVPSGIHVLAHPFRVFRRARIAVPMGLYDPVVRLLREHNVAAELNFHINTPDPEFFRRCLQAGVKIAFGSDAHQQWEVGEFAPHLQLLRDCGYNGDLRDILVAPPQRG